MLAVTANWMLTDGTLASSRAGWAESWIGAVRRAVIRAGVGRDGRYCPADSVSIVFAGDTFDWLLSEAWGDRARPWHGGHSGRATRAQVADASLRAARPALTNLRRWIRQGMPLPAADGHGRPSARGIVHARAQVVILAGDRDAWAGEALEETTKTLGPRGVWVGETWSDGSVNIRHGHDLDPAAHAVAPAAPGPHGRLPALAESLVVDLVVPFAMAVRAEAAVWPVARPWMPSVAAAAPADLPLIVARLAATFGAQSPAGRRVLASWHRCVAAWHQTARREPPVCDAEHDVVDALAAWFEAAAFARELEVPTSVTEIALPRPSGGSILGHVPSGGSCIGLGATGGPWLTVLGHRARSEAIEPLGPCISGPRVVAVDGMARNSDVEAA